MLKLIGMLIACLGVICVYDARLIAKKYFDFGNENEVSSGLKILGYIFSIAGGLIVFFTI